MLLISRDYGSPLTANAAVGLSQFLGLCSAALFLWSADVYRQTHLIDPSRLKPLIPLAAWFIFAPLVLGPASVRVPGYVLSAAILAGAGSMYGALLLERRMIGAGLVALVLYGAAISNLTMAIGSSRFSFEILVLNVVLYTFGAVGIHLLVFEDMTYELRAANRRLETAQQELVQKIANVHSTMCRSAIERSSTLKT